MHGKLHAWRWKGGFAFRQWGVETEMFLIYLIFERSEIKLKTSVVA
jgi:hypothetical protein